MKQIPRLLIIIALFLTAFGIGLALRRLLVPENRGTPSPPVVGTEPPSFPSPAVTGQPRYVVTQKMEFPDRIPLYTVQETIDPGAVVTDLGRLLKLSGSPRPSSGPAGIYYYWNTDKASLTVGGEIVNISYSVEKPLAGTVLTGEDELSLKALSFVSGLSLPQKPYSLKKTGSVYFNPVKDDPRPVQTIKEATIVQLNYGYFLDQAAVVFNPPGTPGASVSVNGAGEVGEFRAAWLPRVEAGGEMVAVISYEEAVVRLVSLRGVLASVEVEPGTGEYYNLLSVPPDVSTIYRTDLSYYYSPGQKTLAPVFVFTGKGTRGKTGLITVTLVSAVPEGQPTTAP